MAGLMAPVSFDENGKPIVDVTESSQKKDSERKLGSELGKEDFLMLLVTQMQYQDPLEPTDNTEYVTQLAQFSELEAMQNLNETANNSTAYSLVGKEVLIQHENSTGDVVELQGTVQYVTIQNGEAYVTVDGERYPYSEVVQVIDPYYLIATYFPSVSKQQLEYNHQDPQDLVVEGLSLGSHGYEAKSFAVALMRVDDSSKTTTIDPKYLSYEKGTLTIDREALESLDAGKYYVGFVFDNADKTVLYEEVTLEIKGIVQKPADPDNGSGSGGTDSGTGGDTDSGTGSGTEGSTGSGTTGTENSGSAGS